MVCDLSQLCEIGKSLVNSRDHMEHHMVRSLWYLRSSWSHLQRRSPFPCKTRKQYRAISRLLKGETRQGQDGLLEAKDESRLAVMSTRERAWRHSQ